MAIYKDFSQIRPVFEVYLGITPFPYSSKTTILNLEWCFFSVLRTGNKGGMTLPFRFRREGGGPVGRMGKYMVWVKQKQPAEQIHE